MDRSHLQRICKTLGIEKLYDHFEEQTSFYMNARPHGRQSMQALVQTVYHNVYHGYEMTLQMHTSKTEAARLVISLMSMADFNYPKFEKIFCHLDTTATKCQEMLKFIGVAHKRHKKDDVLYKILSDLGAFDVYLDDATFCQLYMDAFRKADMTTYAFKEMYMRLMVSRSASWKTRYAKTKALDDNYPQMLKDRLSFADARLIEDNMDNSAKHGDSPYCLATRLMTDYVGHDSDNKFCVQGNDLKMINGLLDHMPIPNRLSVYVMSDLITMAREQAASQKPDTAAVKAAMGLERIITKKEMIDLLRVAAHADLSQ